MGRRDSRDQNPLNLEEKTILSVFRDLGVPAGVDVPANMIGYRAYHGEGFLPTADPSRWETAYVSLEVRGLISPGRDPFSAIAWRLTPRGHALVHTTKGIGLDAS
jgi:hypothetical protein